jgi:hypothetical protein
LSAWYARCDKLEVSVAAYEHIFVKFAGYSDEGVGCICGQDVANVLNYVPVADKYGSHRIRDVMV